MWRRGAARLTLAVLLLLTFAGPLAAVQIDIVAPGTVAIQHPSEEFWTAFTLATVPLFGGASLMFLDRVTFLVSDLLQVQVVEFNFVLFELYSDTSGNGLSVNGNPIGCLPGPDCILEPLGFQNVTPFFPFLEGSGIGIVAMGDGPVTAAVSLPVSLSLTILGLVALTVVARRRR